MSKIVPLVEQALARRAADPAAGLVPPATVLANITGHYCGLVVSLEKSSDGGEHLVLRPASTDSTEYPFVLQWLGRDQDGRAMLRKVMGPEKWLPANWPGCSAEGAQGQALNLCPVSCNRKMARGSGDLVFFDFDTVKSSMRLASQDGFSCHKQ